MRPLRAIQSYPCSQDSGTKINNLQCITMAISFFPFRKQKEICEYKVTCVAFSM